MEKEKNPCRYIRHQTRPVPEVFWNCPGFKFQAQLEININLAIASLGLDKQGVKSTSAS